MALNAEGRTARARLAATRRHHPGTATTELEDDLERARIDEQIDALVASAPRMTDEQATRIRHLFRYGPPPGGDRDDG